MKQKQNDKKKDANSKINENLSSEVPELLNKLRTTGITSIFSMDKKAQMTMLTWAHDSMKQYNDILKNNPMKVKNVTELPCSKMDAKLAIKLLLIESAKKGLEDNMVADLRDKFVSLGTFQSINQKDIKILMRSDTSSFPESNKYMDLIISEQKALLGEISSFIEDIRKIKKDF